MRTFLVTLLALVLIIIGILILGAAGARILQGLGPTATPTPAAVMPAQVVTGLEQGGMTLATATAEAALRALLAPAAALPADEPVEPLPPATVTPTLDPCPPQLEPGYAADANVTALGMLRLYSEPDLASRALGEFSVGQNFLVTTDANGVTAVRRCEVTWVRVRLTGGVWGWVLTSAISLAPIVVTPVIVTPIIVTPVAPATLPPICPGGCATPTCVPPCYNPCPQPCNDPCYSPCGSGYVQPCPTPCGVYSQ